MFESGYDEGFNEAPLRYETGYQTGFKEGSDQYMHTGYVINTASVRCSSEGDLEIIGMYINGTGMLDAAITIHEVNAMLSRCIDNHDREL